MLQQETRCEVADNSGAKEAYVIRVYGGSTKSGAFTRRIAGIGDRVLVSIKKALPGAEVRPATSPRLWLSARPSPPAVPTARM
jgi:large subunit ribosomal protein L14